MRKHWAFLFLMVLVTLFSLSGDEKQAEGSIFRWAIVKKNDDGEISPINIEEKCQISPQEGVKIFVQPIHEAYIYLVSVNERGDFEFFYPEGFDRFTKNTYNFRKSFYPSEEDVWFTLQEDIKIYLFVSAKRLVSLEESYTAYHTLKNVRNRRNVADAIKVLVGRTSSFTQESVTPVPFAGSVRGENEKITAYAVEVAFEDIFRKTIYLGP